MQTAELARITIEKAHERMESMPEGYLVTVHVDESNRLFLSTPSEATFLFWNARVFDSESRANAALRRFMIDAPGLTAEVEAVHVARPREMNEFADRMRRIAEESE